MPSYVRRKGRLFYFRFRVPISLQNRFARTEIPRAIPARTQREAERIARSWLSQCEELCMSTVRETPIKVGDIFKLQSAIASQIGPHEDVLIDRLNSPVEASGYDLSLPANFAAHRHAMAQMLCQQSESNLKGAVVPIPFFDGVVATHPEFVALDDEYKIFLRNEAYKAVGKTYKHSAKIANLSLDLHRFSSEFLIVI
jgi:hypothetical protein